MPNVDPDKRLDALFTQYRDACPDVEGGTNFVPHLWARIESRRRATLKFRRLSSFFVSTAAAASLALGLLAVRLPHATSPVYQATYVETLDEQITPEHALDVVDNTPDVGDTDLI